MYRIYIYISVFFLLNQIVYDRIHITPHIYPVRGIFYFPGIDTKYNGPTACLISERVSFRLAAFR